MTALRPDAEHPVTKGYACHKGIATLDIHHDPDRLDRPMRREPDGSWTEHETTGTGFPKVFYLKYDMYRNTWPLLALATYRNVLDGVAPGRRESYVACGK